MTDIARIVIFKKENDITNWAWPNQAQFIIQLEGLEFLLIFEFFVLI